MVTAVKELNIIIAGVGGQGVVLLSELLGNSAVSDGLKVRGSEVLGMAQRGGSVFSNIRLGTDVEAPMTADSKCDVLIAVEPSEGLRNIQYLNKNTTVILNIRKVIPATVSMGKSTYPEIEQIVAKLKSVTSKVITVDANDLAEKAGNRQSTNVVMLGTLFGSGKVPINVDTIKAQIRERFAGKAAEVNIKAFDLGYEAAKKAL
ncbi:MAG TPA: indolepyruvate oxidoreductase subunit beta [Dehalococcoidales bacterium]